MGFFDWLLGGNDDAGGDERVRLAVEQVIAGIDPRLKGISGSRELLGPAVAHALAFAHEAVGHIPSGVLLTPENWGQSSLLQAFFTRPADISEALSASQDLRDFVMLPAASGIDVLYGVVAATCVERNILGHAMEGGMLRQDVVQKTISFSDMRIAGFAANEEGIREKIEDFVLEQLVLAALRDVAYNRQRSEQLAAYRQLLQMRLRLLEQGGTVLNPVLSGERQEATDVARLRSQLAANEAELNAVRQDGVGFESQLNAVVEALRNAEAIIRPKLLDFRLNAMNIIVGEEVADAADIRLVEFSTANPERPRRVGFLVHFPRTAFVEKAVDFDALLRSI